MSTVTEVADAYLAALAAIDPDAADVVGRPLPLRFGDLSPAGFAARTDLDRRTLAQARTATAATTAERALKAALVDRLESDLALYDAGFTTRLLAPLATPVHLTRQVFDQLPRDTEADWTVVAEHLEALGDALDAYASTLRDAADRGHLVARRQVLAVADQATAWITTDDFYGRLVSAHPGGGCHDRLVAGADQAVAATGRFVDFLRTELAPRAGTVDGVGRDLYAVTSRSFLGARVDLDELYAYGWDELRRTAEQMRQVAAELGHPDTASAMAALDADPAWRVATGPALEQWLNERVEQVTDALDGTHFDIPARTRKVQCRLSPAASGVMYYTPPDAALTRPGGIWWAVPGGQAEIPVWSHVGTLYHEGLPGHHLQFAITMTTDELHPWQRHLCHVHGYAEGWAHYAERLADELGLYRGPAERLGMLCGQIWRAARIVIDMGLHLDAPIPAGNGFTDATAWTTELAVDFLATVAGLDRATARFEVDRYLGWPGQALAFKAGARLWAQARHDAETRAGASFDRKRFHADALRLGPMGLDPLRATLTALTPKDRP
ncbi:DUF885 domain-containing protein [Catellatospora sp. KI3]|uniref:DUF885 domain-containing protein n=1 Tax=Catellatospora sp. KI3 TaxID=3041620 RepID=UPI0024824DE9|nr:DUF885 domain-containing protein [Catellatospora sp. KI3]MDI1463278.1 DUF885 domain-containing protein [Catellatospora sp. KI3]